MRRNGDILFDLLDSETGQYETYEKVTTAPDGSTITDTFINNLSPLYRKSGSEYFKKTKLNGGDYISVKEFGAVGDGVTDDTAAVQAAIDSLTYSQFSTVPSGSGNSWGKATLYFPKGRYNLGSLILNQAYGITFKGDSVHATTLEYNSDSGTFMTFNGHLFTTFEDLSIYHNPIGAFDTWANTCFDFLPTGGGGNFKCVNVFIRNFDVQKRIGGTTNNDNFICINCRFLGFNTYWLNPGNTNSLINKWYGCAWIRGNDVIFDVTAGGTYKIDGGNIVHGQDILRLGEVQGLWSVDSNFHFDNIRMEWYPAPDGIVKTRLVNCTGPNITANVLFTNCGTAGGETHETRPNKFITHNGRVNITFQDCAITSPGLEGTSPPADMEVYRVTSFGGTTGVGDLGTPMVRFIGGTAIYPENVTVNETVSTTAAHAVVEWEGCRNVLNQSKMGRFNIGSRNLNRNIVRVNGDSSNRLFAPVPTDLQFLVYGEKTIINSIYLYGLSITGASDKTINFYSDSAKTTLMTTLTVPGGSKANVGYSMDTFIDPLIDEGIFIEMINPDATGSTGYLLIDYTNVGGTANTQPGYFKTKDSLIQNDRIDFTKETQRANINANKIYTVINDNPGSRTEAFLNNTSASPVTVTVTGVQFQDGAVTTIPANGEAWISLIRSTTLVRGKIEVYS